MDWILWIIFPFPIKHQNDDDDDGGDDDDDDDNDDDDDDGGDDDDDDDSLEVWSNVEQVGLAIFSFGLSLFFQYSAVFRRILQDSEDSSQDTNLN